nr:cytochrome P450 [Curvularia sp.]
MSTASMDFITLTTITTSTVLLFGMIATFALVVSKSNSKSFPHANQPGSLRPIFTKQSEAVQHGIEIFKKAKKQFGDNPFRMITNNGEALILPSRFVNVIRNEENLSFADAIARDFSAHLPGLTTFGILTHKSQVLQNVARKPLTKLLNSVTKPLASETSFATNLIFGNSPEWNETLILDSMLDLIARLSSRVFLGDKLCRNEDWLKITKEYTVNSMKAAHSVSALPGPLKYFLVFFSREGRQARDQLQRARELIIPVIEERRAMKEKAQETGKPAPVFNDAIDWAEAESKGFSYDPASFQLTLSMAAIHTTSDLLSKIMLLLTSNPTDIRPLREEIVNVLKEHGWNKTALFNMKLVDSAMKEAQRLMPNEITGMRRLATKDVQVEDISIRKGQYVMIDGTLAQDPTVFPNPEKFDIYRWKRMREVPEYANKAHFVSTSPEHIGFGHGIHACPGRFFAANEIKIALCFLLLRYDWEAVDVATSEPLHFGTSYLVNPQSTLRYRKRESEIDLEALEFS